MQDYKDFLLNKMAISKDYGFDIDDSDIPEILFPHQKDIVKWAVKGGRRAIFASFGLGKTIIQLTILKIILDKQGGKGLIVCPLGIRQEFKEDARNLLNINIEYIKTLEDAKNSKNQILITNYERVRDGDIDPNFFTVTTLDEASILRGYGTKTYQSFLQLFKNVKFKFVCTATPSPNKYKELIHYAGYLGIMDTGQALTRFFKRDSTKANKLTLYSHKEREFWLWLSSWGVFINKPSDLGYDDTGYDLPEIKYHFHKIEVDHKSAGEDRDGQIKMLRDAAISLKDASTEKRDSLHERVKKAYEIVNNNPDDNFILWHTLESERHELNKYIGNGFDVYGSQDMDKREQRILNFSYGKQKYMITKPVIAGSGCNFQRYCHKAIFVGIDYKFNDFIQAIHRIYRFQQTEQVEIHVIYTESESQILKVLQEKQNKHYLLIDKMVNIIKENGLNNIKGSTQLKRSLGIDRKEVKTEYYTAVNNDCVLETEKLADNSLDLVVTSIPFSNHYEYTPSYNDFGHTDNNDHFFNQLDYLTPNLLRTLKSGRLACIHVKDRILFSSMTDFSFPTVSPFHAQTIFHFMKHGFAFTGMITIETDVVRENNQTYRLGWTEQCKDGSKMGVGSPEYVLLFRKQPTEHNNAYADIPVSKDKSEYTRAMWQIDARAKWNSDGNRLLTPEELKSLDIKTINNLFTEYFESNIYNYKTHKETAEFLEKKDKLPSTFETLKIKERGWNVWSEINRMATLNTKQSQKAKQQHICPLQFDIVDRLITRFSNKGETVYDPFGGLMTVPYRSIALGRKGYGVELNYDYYNDGLAYLNAITNSVQMPSLLDL